MPIETVSRTIQDFIDEPTRTLLRNFTEKLPIISRFFDKKYDYEILGILQLLKAAGLDNLHDGNINKKSNDSGEGSSSAHQPSETINVIEKLNEFCNSSDRSKNSIEFNKEFVNVLYQMFNVMAASGIQNRPGGDAFLEKFKHHIHRFVENNNIRTESNQSDKRIVNISKAKIRQEEEFVSNSFVMRIFYAARYSLTGKKQTNKDGIELGKFEDLLVKNAYLKYMIEARDQGLSWSSDYTVIDKTIIENNLEKIKKLVQKKIGTLKKVTRDTALQAYQIREAQELLKKGEEDLDKLNNFDDLYADIERKLTPHLEKIRTVDNWRKARRIWKIILGFIGLIVSIIVGLGEGGAALYLLLLAGSFPLLLPVAILTFVGGSFVNFYLFGPASQYTINQIFLGKFFKNRQGQELSNIKKILATLSLAFSGGAAAALGALTYSSFIVIFTTLVATTGIVFPPLGILIAAAGIAGMSSISIFSAFSVALRDFVANDRLSQIKSFFKRTYGLPGKATPKQQLNHILKCTVISVCLLLAISLTIFACVFSAGRYHAGMVAFLQGTFGVTGKINAISSAVSMYGLSGALNLLFQGKNNISIFVTVGKWISNLPSEIASFFKTKSSKEESESSSKSNILWRSFLFIANGFNALGQGRGMNSQTIRHVFENISHIPGHIIGYGMQAGSGLNSYVLNAAAIHAETAPTAKINKAETNDITYWEAKKKLDNKKDNGKEIFYSHDNFNDKNKKIANKNHHHFFQGVETLFTPRSNTSSSNPQIPRVNLNASSV